MNLTGIKAGDIVKIDDGMPYYAEVVAKNGTLQVRPLSGGWTGVRTVKARAVVGHWRKSKASR